MALLDFNSHCTHTFGVNHLLKVCFNVLPFGIDNKVSSSFLNYDIYRIIQNVLTFDHELNI
jgi:hypothetical protein